MGTNSRHNPVLHSVPTNVCGTRVYEEYDPEYIEEFYRAEDERGSLPAHPSLDGLGGDCYDNAMCESFFATLEC